MIEKRRHHRPRVCLEALLTDGDLTPIQSVRLRNLNAHGAEIVLPKGYVEAPSIELRLPRTGETKRGQVVWRHFERVGVKFVSQFDDGEGSAQNPEMLDWSDMRARGDQDAVDFWTGARLRRP